MVLENLTIITNLIAIGEIALTCVYCLVYLSLYEMTQHIVKLCHCLFIYCLEHETK